MNKFIFLIFLFTKPEKSGKPLGEEDVRIVEDIIKEIQPHQIYAAGDLSDPHGTHRVCLNSILKAIDNIKDLKWMDDCWLWLYRGAWQEWDIGDIEMAVPLSPEEKDKKEVQYLSINLKKIALFSQAPINVNSGKEWKIEINKQPHCMMN